MNAHGKSIDWILVSWSAGLLFWWFVNFLRSHQFVSMPYQQAPDMMMAYIFLKKCSHCLIFTCHYTDVTIRFHLKLDCCKAVGNEHQSRALCCLFSIIRANVCLTITLAKLMLKPSLVETCWTGFWYQGYGPPHIQHLLDVFLISRLQFCSYSANVILSFYL